MAKPTCSVPGCERTSWARGWCNAHYTRWRATGDPGSAEIRVRAPGRTCLVSGCDRTNVSRDMCRSHYMRWSKTGDPGTGEFKTWYDTRLRDEQGRKRCPSCRLWLPEDGFSKSKGTRDGFHKRCIRCEWDSNLRRSFNITLADYENMMAQQGGGCAVCGRTPDGRERLSVDHDHSCCPEKGKSCGRCVRALLCSRCNTGLGMLQDDVEVLDAAAAYLRKWKMR